MLQNRFRKFVISSGLTNFADGIAVVVWAWMATLLTRDPLLIALVPVALRLPWFVFAIPAGVVTDRMNRKSLIIRMDYLRCLVFFVVAIAVYISTPFSTPPQTGTSNQLLFFALLSAAIIVGTAEVFRDNAAQTMMPSMVPHKELEKANGRLWSVELVGNALLGPALGAMLIAFALPLPFLVNAVAYLAAIALIYNMAGNFTPEPVNNRNWRTDTKEGFAFLNNAPLLRSLAWITGFWNLFFQMAMIALVLHVQDNYGLDVQSYGIMLAAGALGGILGGFCGDAIISKFGPAKTAQWMLLASAPAFFAMAYCPGPVSLAIVLAIFEFTGLVWNTVSVSYRQRSIPDKLLGRVNSLYRLLAWGMMPVGLLLSGLIVRISQGYMAHENALTIPFFVASVGALILGLIGWRTIGNGFKGANTGG